MTTIAIIADWNGKRVDHIKAEMGKMGWEWLTQPAIRAVPGELERTISQKLIQRQMTDNQFGTSSAHGEVLRHLAESPIEDPVNLIVEDDAEFIIDTEALYRAVGALPLTFDFAMTARYEPRGDSPSSWVDQNEPVLIDIPGNDHWRRCYRSQHGTTSYLVSPHGARRLLETFHPIAEPIDILLRRMSHVLECYTAKVPFTAPSIHAGYPATQME